MRTDSKAYFSSNGRGRYSASSPDEACGVRDNRSHECPAFRKLHAGYSLAQKFNASKANKGLVECSFNCKPTSNGAILKPNPNKTTTVLGRFDIDMNRIINDELKIPKNTEFGPKTGGFNVLNVPDELYKNPTQFWEEVNKPFLEQAIQRGDDILMASDPTDIKNLFAKDGSITGFGREVECLIKSGYRYDPITKSMIK